MHTMYVLKWRHDSRERERKREKKNTIKRLISTIYNGILHRLGKDEKQNKDFSNVILLLLPLLLLLLILFELKTMKSALACAFWFSTVSQSIEMKLPAVRIHGNWFNLMRKRILLFWSVDYEVRTNERINTKMNVMMTTTTKTTTTTWTKRENRFSYSSKCTLNVYFFML